MEPPASSLTTWKKQALRLLARAQLRGWVTSADAKQLGLNIRTCIKMRWLLQCGMHTDTVKRYQLGSASTSPHLRHPVEYLTYVQEQREYLSAAASGGTGA
jgi:hypothetical protein